MQQYTIVCISTDQLIVVLFDQFLIYVILCYRVLPESPRWLLTMCQGEKVMNVLKKAANFNGKELPGNTDKIIKQVIYYNLKQSFSLFF